MSTSTAKKPAAKPTSRKAPVKPAPAKPAPAAKQEAKPKEQPKPEPKNLREALTTGQALLFKVRANGTKRSLPYLAPGTEARVQADLDDWRVRVMTASSRLG
jgi:hypothetical protein